MPTADWTILEAIVWVVRRDDAAVNDAKTLAPRFDLALLYPDEENTRWHSAAIEVRDALCAGNLNARRLLPT